MSIDSLQNSPAVDARQGRSPHLLLAAGIGLSVVTVIADRLINDRPLFDEWPPQSSLFFIARAAALGVAMLLLLAGGKRLVDRRLTRQPDNQSTRVVAAAAALGMALALTFAALLALWPETLIAIAREDYIIEWASALCLFVAGLLLLLTALGQLRHGHDRLLVLLLVAMAGLFTLLGLEEVSWFQRQLGLGTPDFFEGNRQQEINFHNFATEASAYSYFIVGTLFGVVVPFLTADRLLPGRFARWQPLLPGRTVMYVAAVGAALIYKMWNVLAIQATFWLTLFALWWDERSLPARLNRVAAVVLIVTLLVFLTQGEKMGRSIDAELREMIIPLSLLLYSVQLYRRLGRRP